MKNLKKELRFVNKELKALAKKFEKIVVAAEKLEKPKIAKKTIAKKIAVKKPIKKKTKKTAADTVFGFIEKSKKGVTTATLMKKTGFAQKKIFNIVYKLKKKGKIKTEARGLYVKV